MKTILIIQFVFFSTIQLFAQRSYKYLKNESYTYEEATHIYSELATKNERAKFIEVGISDVGKPINLFIISNDGDFNFESIDQKQKTVLLINNAIHPGEPCGVDASIKLADQLLNNKKYKTILENVVVCIIPFYNVGGGLNRSCCSRANQNGPKEYGFRGNVKNLDLNRDFIKCDSKNARAFINAYHTCNPDVFIDTHTTNGSDFQYSMSLIATQPDKLQPYLRDYLRNDMLPDLYADMKIKNKEIIPYVYPYKNTPDNGIKDYLETPRYSTGYTTLFNTIGFVTEALKYKDYEDRVEHTYEFLLSTIVWMNTNKKLLKENREKAVAEIINQKSFELNWSLDTAIYDKIDFKGYEVEYVDSKFGENEKLTVYNYEKPYTKQINYYNRFTPSIIVQKPKAYIIPQAYNGVINRLEWNMVKMEQLQSDTIINVEMYIVKDYKTVKKPYEGHYLHYDVSTDKVYKPVKFYKGDYLVFVNQKSNRYIVETLEPTGVDSFFAWNFFDGILQQKEWFSSFSFEKTAQEILKENSALNEFYVKKKKEDFEFAKSRDKQLYYIYTNSKYYEDSHNQYPVARLID